MPPFKSRIFFLGKCNVPRKGTQWPGLGVSNVLRRGAQLSTRHIAVGLTTPHFLSDRQIFPAVLHRRRRAFLRFSSFSTSLQSEPRAAFFA